jgi:tRNA(Arg) A34 adenosine deaminase TadA
MSAAQRFLTQAIDLARDNIRNGGGPFGAVVVKDGAVVATGVNQIVATNDPTAHAELLAIRAAGRALGTPRLEGCTVYASGHPCPMCLAAIYLAGIAEVVYAYSLEDAEPYGLSSAAIYAELAKAPAERSLRIAHLPVGRSDGDVDLYAAWRTVGG